MCSRNMGISCIRFKSKIWQMEKYDKASFFISQNGTLTYYLSVAVINPVPGITVPQHDDLQSPSIRLFVERLVQASDKETKYPHYRLICGRVSQRVMPRASPCHDVSCHETWGWFNIKMPHQHRKSHRGDKTILRPSYLRHGFSSTDKTSLYWIMAESWLLPRQQCRLVQRWPNVGTVVPTLVQR